MYRFANPEYLYALYLIPLFILVYWYTRRLQKRGMNNFANSAMHKVLIPLKSRFKSLTKFIVSMIAFVLLTIGVANPQIGTRIEEVKQVGIDVFILLDVSLSMKAEDIKPSRLEKAKYSIGKLVQKLQGDRIGLIVFSGAAYVQFPLTTDYAAASLFLNSVDVSSVPQPGTAIEPAIQLAMSSFKSDAETKKAIVVITDGEDHEGDLDKIAKSATEKGVSIYTIGYGSPAGVPIPVYNSAGVRVDYKKDRYSNVVLTKLDENTLKQLASAGGGKYYHGSNTEDELELIYKDLSSLEKAEFGATKITQYEDRFYYFIFPALLLLIIEFFISENKSKLSQRFDEV